MFVFNNCITMLCVILQTTTENKMTGIRSFILIVLIGMSASIKETGLNNKSKTQANEFLISKWKVLYKSADVNKDGKLSMEDVKESGNTFSEHLDAEKAKIAKGAFKQYWNECIFLGGEDDISEHEFVDSFKIDFNANPEEFVKEKRKCFEPILSAIDVNEDKSISKEELQIAHAAFGHAKLAKDDDNFSAYGPNNGLVSFNVIVDSWIDFVTNRDESKCNAIKSGYEVDGYE